MAAALKALPNVDVQGGARAIVQKPSIRGLSDNRIVQVIDGVRQNFDLAHRGSYFVPMSLIQEIEVIKGPSSSLWGSGALGGVVAMRTPNALDLLKNNDKFGQKSVKVIKRRIIFPKPKPRCLQQMIGLMPC